MRNIKKRITTSVMAILMAVSTVATVIHTFQSERSTLTRAVASENTSDYQLSYQVKSSIDLYGKMFIGISEDDVPSQGFTFDYELSDFDNDEQAYNKAYEKAYEEYQKARCKEESKNINRGIEEFVISWISDDDYLNKFPVVIPEDMEKLENADGTMMRNYGFLYWLSLSYTLNYAAELKTQTYSPLDNLKYVFESIFKTKTYSLLDGLRGILDGSIFKPQTYNSVDGLRCILDETVKRKDCLINFLDYTYNGEIEDEDGEDVSCNVVEVFRGLNEGILNGFQSERIKDGVKSFYQSLRNNLINQSALVKKKKDQTIDPNNALLQLDKTLFTLCGVDMDNLENIYGEWIGQEQAPLYDQIIIDCSEDINGEALQKYLVYTLNSYLSQINGVFNYTFGMTSDDPSNFNPFRDLIKCIINEVVPLLYKMLDLFDAYNVHDYDNTVVLMLEVGEDMEALWEKAFKEDPIDMIDLYSLYSLEEEPEIERESSLILQYAVLQIYYNADNLWNDGRYSTVVWDKIKEVVNTILESPADELQNIKTQGIAEIKTVIPEPMEEEEPGDDGTENFIVKAINTVVEIIQDIFYQIMLWLSRFVIMLDV